VFTVGGHAGVIAIVARPRFQQALLWDGQAVYLTEL